MRWPFSRQAAAPAEPTTKRPRPAPARNATVPRELYDDLLDKYHALAMAQSAPAAAPPGFVAPPSPSDALGPKTQAALKEMSRGMSSASKRAQLDAAIALSGTLNDDQLADRVRKGERQRMISIG